MDKDLKDVAALVDWSNLAMIIEAIKASLEIKVYDHIGTEPISVQIISSRAETSADTTLRLLDVLAMIGFVEKREDNTFLNTSIGQKLVANQPDSLSGCFTMSNIDQLLGQKGGILKGLRTGKGAVEESFGKSFYEYVSENKEVAKGMDRLNQLENQYEFVYLPQYNFQKFTSVCDLGGGTGKFLEQILEKNPNLQGILLDLPKTIENAKQELQNSSVQSRIQCVSQNIIESVPEAQVYIMRKVFFLLDDEKAMKVCQNIRQSIQNDGQLMLYEIEDNESLFSTTVNWRRASWGNSQVRTQDDYNSIALKSGFKVQEVIRYQKQTHYQPVVKVRNPVPPCYFIQVWTPV